MTRTVGLLVGLENTFPYPFVESVNEQGRSQGIKAEMVYLGGAGELEEPPRYDVIVDCQEPGVWAFHCHILSHAESAHGMFGMVTALVIK